MKEYLHIDEHTVCSMKEDPQGLWVEIPPGANYAWQKGSVTTFTDDRYVPEEFNLVWSRGDVMKEYLTKASSDEYKLINYCSSDDDIEIPRGADFATGVWPDILFRKDGFYFEYGRWEDTGVKLEHFPIGGVNLLWQRHPIAVVDNVNQPQHYCSYPSGIECIEITQHHDFSVGNAIKYLWRAGLKGSDTEVQDLKKAAWYINNKIKLLESSDD